MAAPVTAEMLFALGSWDFPLSRAEQIHRAIWAYENELALSSQCEGVLVREIQRLQLRVNEFEAGGFQGKAQSAFVAEEQPPDQVPKGRVRFAADSLESKPAKAMMKKNTCGQMQEQHEIVAADAPKPVAEVTRPRGSQQEARISDDQGVNENVSGFANLLSALHTMPPRQELQPGGKTRKGEGKSSQLRGRGKHEDGQGRQRDREPGQGMQRYGQVDDYVRAQAVVTPPPGLFHPSSSAPSSFSPAASRPSDPLPAGLQQPHVRPPGLRREQVFESGSVSVSARETASQLPLSGAWNSKGNRSGRRGGKGGRSGGGNAGGAHKGAGKRR